MEKMPPGTAELMTLQGFKENPEAFYSHFRPYLERILSAKPNPAHIALAELEAGGYLASDYHHEWGYAAPEGRFTKGDRNARHHREGGMHALLPA